MVPRRSAWWCVLFGGGCLAAGAAIGRVWAGCLPAPAPSAGSANHSLPSFADVVAAAQPAVVAVRAQYATTATGASTSAPRVRDGSGFVCDSAGHVLTCLHVVADAQAIEVQVPLRGVFRGEVIGRDRATDLALLRLQNAPPNLPCLPFRSGPSLRAGDWVLALGNPVGFAQTASAGLVSFVGRQLPHSDFGVTNDFLQLSVPVHPGSSGGPVLDLHGEVVGVTTQAAAQASGIAFAVPSHTARWCTAAMLRAEGGLVRRGYLGIEFTSRSPVVGGRPGALITGVKAGEPAAKAGVRRGDIVVGIDGDPLADARALQERIACAEPGTTIALQLLRDGLMQDPVLAVLGEVGPRPLDEPN